MDALVVALVHEPVVGALDDGEAQVEGIAHGVDALALGQLAGERPRIELEPGQARGVVDAHHREVVGHVDREQAQRTARAVGREVFQAVGPRIEGELGHDVVVRDGVAVDAHQEAGAQGGLAPRRLQQRANLQDARLGQLVHPLGRGGQARLGARLRLDGIGPRGRVRRRVRGAARDGPEMATDAATSPAVTSEMRDGMRERRRGGSSESYQRSARIPRGAAPFHRARAWGMISGRIDPIIPPMATFPVLRRRAPR